MELVDEADPLAPKAGAAPVVHVGRRLAADVDLAAVRLLQQARDVEQGRLARAGGRDEGDGLARPQGEVGAAQDVERGLALPVAALHARQEQGRRPDGRLRRVPLGHVEIRHRAQP